MEEGIFRGRKIQFSQEYLSLKQGKQIQALACVGIMIHHVTQQITSYGSNPKDLSQCLDFIALNR